MKRRFLLLLLPLMAAAAAAQVTRGSEREAVEQAVLDYVDALYMVEPARIDRSVHPQLAKVGFSRATDDSGYREMRMSFAELQGLAGRWNANGRLDRVRAPRRVEVLDMLDQTASAKLTADWGVDYLHLAKYDGKWQIVNVLWQSHPPRRAGS